MMILLSDAGKRFNHEWIFRHFTYRFETGNSYAITGHNGSGKSTLLQVIGGSMLMNEGKIEWTHNNKPVSTENIFAQVSICAPYLDVIEEMTLREFLQFHQTFKPFIQNISIEKIIAILGLDKAADKQIRYYSSGMRQRAKLAQCIFSDTAIVLLDEPCTNLDEEGINLYHRLINEYCCDRLVIVSSNDKTEYSFCKNTIAISDYKKE